MTSIKTLALCLALSLPTAALAQMAPTQAVPNQTAPAATAQTATLVLTFPDLTQKAGVIMIAVFDSPQAWASGKASQVAVVAAADLTPAARLEGLAPGTYAVRAFQDLDSNGKMGANPFGLPTEPYGFSNGAKANMGPPSFEAASFAVLAGDNAQTVVLK